MNRQIAATLVSLADNDLQVRERLIGEGKLSGGGYNAEMETVHRENAACLGEKACFEC